MQIIWCEFGTAKRLTQVADINYDKKCYIIQDKSQLTN